MLATNRISEEAYDDVIDALSQFKIDEISVKANNMYPAKKAIRASVEKSEENGHQVPAIVLESKANPDAIETFASRLSAQFTVGCKDFDEKLTRYGDK